ncbi:MAG: alpha/beta fold hydrolase [Gammaproteobacteria bacterium]
MQLIFIPGLSCTTQVWGNLNKLRQKYPCLDANVTSHDTITQMADAILQNVPEEDFALIGISMGGYVAIDIASRNPPNLKKLILLNTSANSVNVSTIKDRETAIKFVEQGKLKNILSLSQGLSFANPKKEWQDIVEKMALEVGGEAYVKQQRAIINRKNYSSSLKNITAETLIISGKQDQIIPYQDSIFLFENIPNANLVLLDKCGHLSTLEKGNIVEAYVTGFLAERNQCCD